MTYRAPSLLLSDFLFVSIRGPIRVHSRFFSTWQRSDGDLERRISEGARRCLQALAKSSPGINSAFAMPMPHYSPGSITPTFSEDTSVGAAFPRPRDEADVRSAVKRAKPGGAASCPTNLFQRLTQGFVRQPPDYKYLTASDFAPSRPLPMSDKTRLHYTALFSPFTSAPSA
jgi:hypothetical protein